MDNDDAVPGPAFPAPPPAAGRTSPRRSRWAMGVIGAVLLAVLAVALDRAFVVRAGALQRVVVSRDGEIVEVIGPGQASLLNPWTHGRTVFDMGLIAADRSTGARGMPALTAEGHQVTLFGTAFWHEGEEADLRWRFGHLRPQLDTMQVLMAASTRAVAGRFPMDALIGRGQDLTVALTEDLRARARALLRVEVVSFEVTGLEPGESYRRVVAERELGRARAASVAASPAVHADPGQAVEVERIRQWDGRGVMQDLVERNGRRASGVQETR